MKGDLAAQYAALREGCGLWTNTTRTLVAVTGEDRVRLLDGLLTCELKAASPGDGIHGVFTDVKGHVLADVVVLMADETLWLDLPRANASAIAAHIEKYILADRVEVGKTETHRAVTLLGPRATQVLTDVLGEAAIPREPWRHHQTDLAGQALRIVRDAGQGVPAVTVWTMAPMIGSLGQRLLEIRGGGLTEVGDESVDVVRIEESVPRFGVDFGPDNLPQETGLEESVVSYTKGCFLGQEVVARLHYRGQVARRLCSLRAEPATEVPPVGTQLHLEGRQAGTIQKNHFKCRT